jgi:uncharacterized damage-inducible protein DinB
MKKNTLDAFEQVEQQLNRLLLHLEAYPEGRLSRQPSPEQWSVLQVVEHLLRVEKVALGYILKKSSGGYSSMPRQGWLSILLLATLRLYLVLPIKVKAPKAVDVPLQDPMPDLAELAREYRQTRASFREFLQNAPEEAFEVNIFRHPLVGRLRLRETLGFLSAHFERHRSQIQRLLSATP